MEQVCSTIELNTKTYFLTVSEIGVFCNILYINNNFKHLFY